MYEMEGALPGRKVARQPVAWPPRHRGPSARARYPRAFPVSRFLLRPRSFLRVVPVSGSKRFLLPRRGVAQGFSWKSSRLFLSTRYPQKTAGCPQVVAVIHRIINSSSTGYRMSPECHQKAIISPVAIGNRPKRLFAPFAGEDRAAQAASSACNCLTTASASLTCWPTLVIELKTCRTVPVRSIT